MSKKIKLTQGKYTIVDDEDYIFLNRLDWNYLPPNNKDKLECAIRCYISPQGRTIEITMHSLLIKNKKQCTIRHKNGKGLDNRKSNLEIISYSIRGHSKRKNRKKISKYKGVSKTTNSKKQWRAEIMKNKKSYFLGNFETDKKAALAYNKKAEELYGKFAYQNIIK